MVLERNVNVSFLLMWSQKFHQTISACLSFQKINGTKGPHLLNIFSKCFLVPNVEFYHESKLGILNFHHSPKVNGYPGPNTENIPFGSFVWGTQWSKKEKTLKLGIWAANVETSHCKDGYIYQPWPWPKVVANYGDVNRWKRNLRSLPWSWLMIEEWGRHVWKNATSMNFIEILNQREGWMELQHHPGMKRMITILHITDFMLGFRIWGCTSLKIHLLQPPSRKRRKIGAPLQS